MLWREESCQLFAYNARQLLFARVSSCSRCLSVHTSQLRAGCRSSWQPVSCSRIRLPLNLSPHNPTRIIIHTRTGTNTSSFCSALPLSLPAKVSLLGDRRSGIVYGFTGLGETLRILRGHRNEQRTERFGIGSIILTVHEL